MADYGRKVRQVLQENGCHLLRQGKGDHEIWVNPKNHKQTTVDGKIKSRHSANGILKQLEVNFHF